MLAIPGVRICGVSAACSAYGRPVARSSASRTRSASWNAPSADSNRTIALFWIRSAAVKSDTSTSPPRPVVARRSSAAATPNASIIAHM